jgi:serine/threonine protein kinase
MARISALTPLSFFQAPEIRSPPYNALKVDVWALGATVWEVAETVPPFSETNAVADRWPSVSRPEVYSPAFHDFLRLCSDPVETRLPASELLKVRRSVCSIDNILIAACRLHSSKTHAADWSSNN